MYQTPLDHSNHRMLYSFTPGAYGPQPTQPVYAQMIDSTYHHPPSPSLTPSQVPSPRHNQSQQIYFHPHNHSTDFNTEMRSRRDMRSLQEDYQKLFVGGEISDVSSNTKAKPVEAKSISMEKYSEEMNAVKEQYQRKLDYIEEQNEQNERSIKQQYELYLDKLRMENTELIGINKEYQNEIKELLRKMEGISLSDLNNYRNENSRLKLIIEQLQESRIFNRNNSPSPNPPPSPSPPPPPKVIIETKLIQNKEQALYFTQQLQRSKRIIETRDLQIKQLTQEVTSLRTQLTSLKKDTFSSKNPTQNDFLFQIQRFKEIINKKNNEMSSITNIKTSLEKHILLLEQSVEELSEFKEKYYLVLKEKQGLEQSEGEMRRVLNDRVKEVQMLGVEKAHLVKKEEYLGGKISGLEHRYRGVESELRETRGQLDVEKRKRKEKLQSKEYEQYIQEMSDTVKEFKVRMNESQRMQENEKQVFTKQQQIMDAKFTELTGVLEGKEKELGELSGSLNQAHSEIVKQVARIKEYEETIRGLRAQLDSKNESYESRRSQYEKNLIKFKNEAEIGYNKNIEQFKERISRLEMELAQKSPERRKANNKHMRSPSKPRKEATRRDSSRSASNNGELRTEEFEQRVNEFLKFNKSEEVYQVLQQAKLELRYLASQNHELVSVIKMLQTSKDLNNKSIIAEDKIRWGEARLDYINQKNMELEERITILIAVNIELKGRVEESSVKIQEIQKRSVEYQEKLEKSEEFARESAEKSKEQYQKLFQLHTSTTNKIPQLQRTIGDLTRELDHKNTTIRQLNNKTQTETTTTQSKSSYFYNRINSLNKDLQYAHQDIEQLKGKVWSLERDLTESNGEIEVLKEEIQAKETEHKIMLAKHSEVSIDSNLKSQEVAALKLEIVTLKNTNEYLNERLKTFATEDERKNQVTTKEILNLHNQLEQSSITLQSFKQHRESSEQAVKEAKNQISRLNNQITQLRFALEKKERELNEMKLSPQPQPRVESRGSNDGHGTKSSVLMQEKLTRANTEISTLTNKTISYELQITKLKQTQAQLEGKIMIITQQLQSQNSQKSQLQFDLNKMNDELMTVSRSSKQIQRKESGSSKQIFELERRLKIVNQEKESLMKQLKQYVTQNHNETSQKQDKLNIFLKQNLDATQLELQRASQTIFSLQASNEHYYTLIQQIPARYSYYISYMKKINSQFRYLVGELDLTSSPKNSQVSNKLLSNIAESLQIFDQIKHLEDQVESRIHDLEERMNA